MPKLSPPSDGATSAFAAEELRGQLVLREEAEHVDSLVRHAQPREEKPDCERVGADERSRAPGPAPDLGPGAEQDLQALAGLLPADEDDVASSRPAGSASSGTRTPFGISSYSPGK